MAISESTPRTNPAPLGRSFAATPPDSDPYLKPDTVRKETVSCVGMDLPPLLHGIQPGLDFQGNPKDYEVAAMWIDRHQVDRLLSHVANKFPELELSMSVVRSYLGHLDTSMNEAMAQMSSARSALENGKLDQAAKAADTALSMFCRWNDSRRLLVRC